MGGPSGLPFLLLVGFERGIAGNRLNCNEVLEDGTRVPRVSGSMGQEAVATPANRGWCDSGFGGVEGVDCGVGDARDDVEVLGVATIGGAGAAVGVGAADVFDTGHDAGARRVGGLAGEPG